MKRTWVHCSDQDYKRKLSTMNPPQKVFLKTPTIAPNPNELTQEKRKKEDLSDDKLDHSLMTYEKYKVYDEMMVSQIKDSAKQLDYEMKRLIFLMIQKPKVKVNQCITNQSFHLELPRCSLASPRLRWKERNMSDHRHAAKALLPVRGEEK